MTRGISHVTRVGTLLDYCSDLGGNCVFYCTKDCAALTASRLFRRGNIMYLLLVV